VFRGRLSAHLSIRYIGFSGTCAIAVGLSTLTKTVAVPLYHGTLSEILEETGSGWIVTGVAVGMLAGKARYLRLDEEAGRDWLLIYLIWQRTGRLE
jgi:hypothetical protein